MRNISIIDETFDMYVTSSYHLCIQASALGLTYAILDTVRVKFIAFKNILFGEILQGEALFDKIDLLFNTEGNLKQDYKRLYFNFLNPKATLVPSALFSHERQEEFLSLFEKSAEKEVIMHKLIPAVEAQLVYCIPQNLHDLVEHHLDAPAFYHQAYPFIENALITAKGK